MADFSITSPVNIESEVLVVQQNTSTPVIVTRNNPVIGIGDNIFTSNTALPATGFTHVPQYTFTITTPVRVVPLDSRPATGQVYPR